LVTGADRKDNPMLYTGGGSTELTLDLVFDVSLAGSSIETEDVRDLTRRLWGLSENARNSRGYGKPPKCRVVWDKKLDLSGIVTAVAERLESFTSSGVPRRSWLRMQMFRIDEQAASTSDESPPAGTPRMLPTGLTGAGESLDSSGLSAGTSGEIVTSAPGERLDQLAHRYFGDERLWRRLALHNGIDDPLNIPAGQRLEIPAS
jgi:hypothetical protein